MEELFPFRVGSLQHRAASALSRAALAASTAVVALTVPFFGYVLVRVR